MRHPLRLLIAVGALMLVMLPGSLAARAGDSPTATVAPPSSGSPASEVLPNLQTTPTRPLRGVVYAWEAGRLVRVAQASIGTGEKAFTTDASGRFTIPLAQRTGQINVVAPGYEIERRQTNADYMVIFLRPLDVEPIYLPMDHLRNPDVLAWALGLARDGVINSLVIDVKDEGGSVLPLAADDISIEMGAVVSTGTDVEGFLEELRRLGVYRIARVVTFLDGWLARASPADAALTYEGTVFVDSIGLAWTNPFRDRARLHNVQVGVQAARYFEEIQYDYVRFPTDPGVAIRAQSTPEQRSGAITQFAAEASVALHAVGAAISFDTFGQTTMIAHDDGIGQVLEDLAPYLDYYSPMIYPSTWSTGWFGLVYPPSDPFLVVRESVARAVNRLAPYNIVVRPWLQDFHDYQSQKLFYGPEEVLAQIRASAQAGGEGFMLWDPSLNYHIGVLADLDALLGRGPGAASLP